MSILGSQMRSTSGPPTTNILGQKQALPGSRQISCRQDMPDIQGSYRSDDGGKGEEITVAANQVEVERSKLNSESITHRTNKTNAGLDPIGQPANTPRVNLVNDNNNNRESNS